MSTLTWLHISDLHFRAIEPFRWEADIVLKGLVNDISTCLTQYNISPQYVLVTGDIAYSGDPREYEIVKSFFDKVLRVVNLPKDRLIIVPGNHDIIRSRVTFGAKTIVESLTTRDRVQEALIAELDKNLILDKFTHYRQFINEYFGIGTFGDDYYFVRDATISGKKILFLGLNSAWAGCGGREDGKKIVLGEKQVRGALAIGNPADLKIVLMHHPLNWMTDFDSDVCEPLLMDQCSIILTGHLHRTSIDFKSNPDNQALLIAAGACFESRQTRNAYNFVKLNLDNKRGTIYARMWNSSGAGFWSPDTVTYRNVREGLYDFSLDEFRFAQSATGNTLDRVETQFLHYTDQALSRINTVIPGIGSIPRREVSLVEEQLKRGEPTILTGDAGTGKSGIAASLIESARSNDSTCLLLDARNVSNINSEADLRSFLDLEGPLHAAIKQAGRFKKCRVVIDQLDNVIGSATASVLVELAKTISQYEGVEVIVISRRRESHETRLLEGLTNSGFVELMSQPLTPVESESILQQLGIAEAPAELIQMCCNLLNLSLIAKIKEQRLVASFSSITDEVNLWDQYVHAIIRAETTIYGEHAAHDLIAEAIRLSRLGLSNDGRTFTLDYPPNSAQNRLISWGIIIPDGRVGRFYHEKLQDYLYAWDATERQLMPTGVLAEVDEIKSRNVFVWMNKIYSRKNNKLYTRFLEELLNG